MSPGIAVAYMVWKHVHPQRHNLSRWIIPFLVASEKKLSTGVGMSNCVDVEDNLSVRKRKFLQKYCLLDNTVCALCRQQANIELASLNWCNYVIFSQLCYYYIVICYQYLVNKALCVEDMQQSAGIPAENTHIISSKCIGSDVTASSASSHRPIDGTKPFLLCIVYFWPS